MGVRGHYEKAFEAFLRSHRVPYLAIDDRVRPVVGDVNVKCFDFIVLPLSAGPLLCEIKGKKFPSRAGSSRRRYWESWVPMGDLKGLSFWSRLFGRRFEPFVVFVYWLQSGDDPNVDAPLLATRIVLQSRLYALVAVALADFIDHGKSRSARWDAVSMSTADLTRTAKPLGLLLK